MATSNENSEDNEYNIDENGECFNRPIMLDPLNIKEEAPSPSSNGDHSVEIEAAENNETNFESVENVICIKKEISEERNDVNLDQDPISIHKDIYIKEENISEKFSSGNSLISIVKDTTEDLERTEDLLPAELCEVQVGIQKSTSKFKTKVERKSELKHSSLLRICKCGQECMKITPNIKEEIYETFCKLSGNEKSVFLAQCMEMKEPLRRKVKGISRRKCTFSYSVKIDGFSDRIKICLKTLCDLTGVTPRKIQVLKDKVKSGKTDFSDLRGRHYNRPHRIADNVRDLVRRHISSCLSHLQYGKVESGRFSITPPTLNVKEMYDMFKLKYPGLKLSANVFRRIFHSGFKL